MFELRLTRRAQDDLEEIAGYIRSESRDTSIARRFVHHLLARCVDLSASPFKLGRSCEELGPGLRCLAEGNYLILFRYFENRLEIARIVEGHRALEHLFNDDPNP